MTRLHLAFVKAYKDRHGKQRCYYRRPGFKSVALPGEVGSAEFMAAYQAALDGETAPRRQIGAERTKPGSLSALIVAYYTSTDFLQLAASSQRSRRNIMERLREKHGDKSVVGLEGRHVRAMLDAKAATPEAANNLRKALRTLMVFAVERDWRKDDPTQGIRKLRSKTEGHKSWSDAEIAKFEQHWAPGTRARRALALLLYTAQRRSDVVTMGRQHVRDGRISVRQQKTTRRLAIKIHPALQAELDLAPADDLTFLTVQGGAPFSPPGFTNWFVECSKAAGLTNCTPHGLRKAAARRLAEAGCSANEIASVTGHTTLKEVAHYTAAADQEGLADTAIGRLNQAEG
jgi:integrase